MQSINVFGHLGDYILYGSIALVVVAVLVGRYLAGGRKGQQIQTGISFVEGLPGSGKSFKLVADIINIIVMERRPVYTNLPLKFRVMRRFIARRWGADLSNLIYEVSREHFVRHCVRTDRIAKEREFFELGRAGWEREVQSAYRDGDVKRAAFLRRQSLEMWGEAAFQARVSSEVGEPIYTGKDANSIHPTAVIIIDEAHKLFPMDEQRGRKSVSGRSEEPEIFRYLSMHRHQLQRVIVATQDRGEVSISFRKLSEGTWVVRNCEEDKVAWGLRWKHFGMSALGYAYYTRAQEEGVMGDVQPTFNYKVWHRSPWQRWKFRLYQSHTHGGSTRTLLKMRASARRDAGLSDDGLLQEEVDRMAKEKADKREARKPHRVMRFVGRWMKRAAILGIVFGLGRVSAKSGPVIKPEAPLALAMPAAPAPEHQWGKFTSFGPGFVRVAGKRVDIGGSHEGATLVAVHMPSRSALWHLGVDAWVWRYGDERPTRMGLAADGGSPGSARRASQGLVRDSGVQAP